jgi:hypothetical protein
MRAKFISRRRSRTAHGVASADQGGRLGDTSRCQTRHRHCEHSERLARRVQRGRHGVVDFISSGRRAFRESRPVFATNVVVDFDGLSALGIQTVPAIFSRARDPVVIARLDVEMVPLVAALGLRKFLPAIFDGASGLREGNATDAGRPFPVPGLRSMYIIRDFGMPIGLHVLRGGVLDNAPGYTTKNARSLDRAL